MILKSFSELQYLKLPGLTTLAITTLQDMSHNDIGLAPKWQKHPTGP